MKLNEKIAWYRRENKLSQEELAARVGVSRQAVSKWELGEASPDVGKLLALARAFGVTTDHLLNGEEAPERDTPPPQAASTAPPAPSQDALPNLPGFLGKMVRRWGWLAGIYLALEGAGVALVGFIARWFFGSMFSAATKASNQMMDVMGGFGMTGGWTYDGPPELEGAFMDALGIAPQTVPQASPLSEMGSFFLGVSTLILVIGLIMAAGGLILAWVLWKNGRNEG